MPAGRAILPEPDEVAQVRWVSVPELQAALQAEARSYAPWLPGVTEALARSTGPDDGSQERLGGG